jgi:dipeptidyl aminopeptidase/acylaminoacyl peptidase
MSSETSSASQPPTKTPRLRITPRALLEVKRISDLNVHPDGHCVAFVVTEADFEDSAFVPHLWLTELPGPPDADNVETEAEATEATSADDDWTRQLTYAQEGESHPRWSPDGRYLAFLSARPDPTEHPDDDDGEPPREQVWILPGDGGEARKVTSAKEGILDFHWTPDNAALIYLTPEPRPRPIEAARKEERQRRRIDPVVEHEDRRRRQFWRVDVEERKPKLLFTGDPGVEEFALSPDGERLVFSTNYNGDMNDYHIADLYVRSLSDATQYKLTARAGGKYRLRWSPDGAHLAFLSWLDPALSFSSECLFVVEVPAKAAAEASGRYGLDAPGVAESRLVSEQAQDVLEFEWSAQDGGLYALLATGMETRLWRFDLRGEAVPIALEEATERRWLALDRQSAGMAWVEEHVEAMPDIYWRNGEGKVTALTRLNADFAQTYRLPRVESLSWNSSDGLRIEGMLVYPLDYTQGVRVPLIVQVHGGPKGRATQTLRNYYMSPVWASEGYAVLLPNFRGSEGYGNAFAVANWRDLGGGDFDDIMAGVDWCIAQGIADPERLGIMGGSYGGYMTNWAIGHTDRFRAAVSLFGIFHLQTDYSNSELSRWDNDYLGAYYWEDPEIYRRLSPGSYLQNITTPTLILHGDDDTNTNISNSRELYQALRHRGVQTQFVHYPREGHGLNEPNHRLDEMRRCLAWMDRYLRRGGASSEMFRPGDRVPHRDGLLELCVTRLEIGHYLGYPPLENEAETLLEVAFTLQHREGEAVASPLILRIAEIGLELANLSGERQAPIGVPLEGPGGKALLEGENLRIPLHPDPETGQLAVGCAVVFRVPRTGEGLVRVADFPPVAAFWSTEPADASAPSPAPNPS